MTTIRTIVDNLVKTLSGAALAVTVLIAGTTAAHARVEPIEPGFAPTGTAELPQPAAPVATGGTGSTTWELFAAGLLSAALAVAVTLLAVRLVTGRRGAPRAAAST